MSETRLPDPQDLRDLAIAALEDSKAQDIQVMDLTQRSSFADFMIICTGTSSRQVKSMAERLVQRAKARGIRPYGVEGTDEGEWVLVDLTDVVIHVMLPQTRAHYNLEKLWSAPVAETLTARA